MKSSALLCLLLATVFVVSFFSHQKTATAANPDWPNEPWEDPRLEPPDDPGFSNRWYLLSYIPDAALNTIREAELELGSGVHADRAYQVTIGSPNVLIAVLDSGIFWNRYDLLNKFFINRGEVPLPEGSDVYDANLDGSFDIRDYNGDSRVFDANGNGRIEPGDLIIIFSDGLDDDGNGYIDDISGWDFHRHDNDPNDDTGFGHGTGESTWAAAEANNGSGEIGVCPGCQVLPVRVADSFIGDINNFAQGVIFATDSGAQVILEALGTVNNSRFAREAVRYAVERGVSIAASAADENSFHHNYPASYNRTIHTDNIVHDRENAEDITSYLALDSCTNWGPKTTVGASSWSCSSGATGVMGGALGMIYSRAEDIDLNPPLSSAEVFSLVTASATDVYIPEAAWKPFIYRSRPGWDKYFGHGRLNLRDAVDMVMPYTIPPEAYIESPEWFEIADASTRLISVYGYIDARRADSYSYELLAATTLEPGEGDWVLMEQYEGLSMAVDGLLGVLDMSQLPEQKAVARDVTEHYVVLLKLEVEDSNGNEVKYYHSFFYLHDEDWVAGFPLNLESSGEAHSLMVDINGDEVYELIVPTSSGEIHVFRADGSEMPGWPAQTGLLLGQHEDDEPSYLGSNAYTAHDFPSDHKQAILGAPAAADIDRDGDIEILVTTMDGAVYAWQHDGRIRPGFPVYMDSSHLSNPSWKVDLGAVGGPVLVDLDQDYSRQLEIIVAGMDQWVYAWDHTGRQLPGWPVLCRDEGQGTRIVSTPATADLDGDGKTEILVTTNERYSNEGRMYAIQAEGENHPGGPFVKNWPVAIPSLLDYYLPMVGEGTPSTPVAADFDSDGADEAVVNSGIGLPVIYDGDGTAIRLLSPLALGLFNGTFELLMGTLNSNYAVADLKGNGRLAIISGGIGAFFALQVGLSGYRIPADHLIAAWWADSGMMLPHWPNYLEDVQLTNAHAVADINGDGKPEVITGSGGHYVHAYDFRGEEPEGWPKFTGGWITAAPSVGDMDGDGYLEVAATTREGYLFVWRTDGPADGNIQWSSFAHDQRNTGNYSTPLSQQPGPPVTDDDTIDDDIADDDTTDDDLTDDDVDDDIIDDDLVDDDQSDDDILDDDQSDDDIAIDDDSDDDESLNDQPISDDDDDKACGC